jgi:DNA-damage-inducible protein D
MINNLDSTIKALDNAKKKTKNGLDYWIARDIQKILGYTNWENFFNVIQKACMACESSGENIEKHFLDFKEMVEIGSGAKRERINYFLDRYACYLIAMNGDAEKAEIATAQAYFAVQTRRQELQDKLTVDERRIYLRNRVKNANLSLASIAKKVGVQKYGVFQNAGYLGLYEMGLSDIKKYKNINNKENLLDRMGRTELAANEFRITQTEDKIIRENIRGEKQAIDTHHNVGKEVRNTIKKLSGIMPENLPPEPPIKELINKIKKQIK